MIRTIFTALALAALLSCSRANASTPPPDAVSYCDAHPCEPMPWSPDACEDMPDGTKQCCNVDGGCVVLEAIQFCCHPVTNVCVETKLLSNCDPDDYVAICDWGQTNADGSITCYD